MSDTEILNVVS